MTIGKQRRVQGATSRTVADETTAMAGHIGNTCTRSSHGGTPRRRPRPRGARKMRAVYHERLSELSHKLGEMSGPAGSAIGRATQALLEADLSLAKRVITDHEQIVACRGL